MNTKYSIMRHPKSKKRSMMLLAFPVLAICYECVVLIALNGNIVRSWDVAFRADEAVLRSYFHSSDLLLQSLSSSSSSSSSSVAFRNQQGFEEMTTHPEDGRTIDRIYFFNSLVNPIRREFMLTWLKKQPIPFQRLEVISTNYSVCSNSSITADFVTTSNKCHRQVEMALSYLYLLYHGYETDGSSLILQDDTVSLKHPFGEILSETIKELPSNSWDAIRLDCHEFHADSSSSSVSDGETKKWFRQKGNNTCYRSNAILWRNKESLSKLKIRFPNPSNGFDKVSKILHEKQYDIDCLLGDDTTFETYCINLNFTSSNNEEAISEPKEAIVENAWFLSEWYTRISIERIRNVTKNNYYDNQHQKVKRRQKRKRNPADDNNIKIDQVYYVNLPKNKLRSQTMDIWLKDQPIPFKRVDAIVGDKDSCVERHNNTNRCKGIAGINQSFMRILEQENTTGVTMVLEDDVIPVDTNLDRLLEAIQMVPSDWDIIRIDCWGLRQFEFPRWVNDFVVDTTKYYRQDWCKNKTETCLERLYGGAFSMLWKGTSIDKLKKIWSKQPYDDADGQIAGRRKVKSYCVNIGFWDHLYIKNSWSDASLLNE